MCGRAMRRNGFTKARPQRWRCDACRLSTVAERGDPACRAEFRAFIAWVTGKESMGEAAARLGITRQTFSARIAWCWSVEPVLPPASRSHRYVMADGTYVPYGWCLLALTGDDGQPVAWQWCSTETKDAYRQLFGRSKRPGLLVCDGGQGCLAAAGARWKGVRAQRCLVHVLRNTRVDLTNRPKSEAGRALLRLARRLTKISTVDGAANWLAELNAWHGEHGDYLKERTTAKQDPAHARGRKWWWTHERLRRACFRLVRLNRAGMLFAFCDPAIAGGRRIVAVDHEPAGRRDQRGCQAHARPPPGTVGRAYETVLRMDGVYAHGTSRHHVVRHARLLEIHRKGTGGGRRADARDRDRRATAGRRRRRLRGRVRHQERLGRTLSLTHRHAIDTHDKTHFSLLNPFFPPYENGAESLSRIRP